MNSKLFYGALASSKQAGLLKAERISRMLDCETAEEAFKLATEGGFGGGSAQTIEQAIAFERNALAEFIKNECPSEKLKKYLLCRYDFLNAETLLKAKHIGFDCKEILIDCGLISPTFLRESINADFYEELPKPLASALTTADKLFIDKTADGFTINNLFVKAYYEYVLQLTKGSFLAQDVIKKIDCANLMTAVRCDGDVDLFDATFIEGGRISREKVSILLSKDFATAEKEFLFDDASEFVKLLAKDFAEGRALVLAESYADSQAIKSLSQRRFDLTPTEEFYLYWLYKQSQITNVNVIVVGLNSNADKAEIKMRMRESYEN